MIVNYKRLIRKIWRLVIVVIVALLCFFILSCDATTHYQTDKMYTYTVVYSLEDDGYPYEKSAAWSGPLSNKRVVDVRREGRLFKLVIYNDGRPIEVIDSSEQPISIRLIEIEEVKK